MGLLIKQLTYHYLTALNGALFLYPNQLACDWTSGSVPPVTSILDARNLLTIGAYAFLAFAVRHVINNCRDQPAIGMVSLCAVCLFFKIEVSFSSLGSVDSYFLMTGF